MGGWWAWEHSLPCRKRGEAKGDRQKSDQKRQKKLQNGYQKVTETEKSDLPPFAYPLLRHVKFSWEEEVGGLEAAAGDWRPDLGNTSAEITPLILPYKEVFS